MVCNDRSSIQTADNGKTPWAKPDYSLKASWSFRTKEKIICMCEGARNCTRENPTRQRGGNAIVGTHSSWVGDKVLALARPWQDNVVKYNMVEAFVKCNIGMILNLQEVGEHENCGPGNLPHTGFSYDPESFTSACIGFYNFAWTDMGVPDLDRMMDIVQVMDYVTVSEGRKIAVHCHAGLGRTGLAIACFFLFNKTQSAQSAVTFVRQYRQGALQTSAQVLFVSVFEQYMAYLRCIFGGLEASPPRPGAAEAKSLVDVSQVSMGASSAPAQQLSQPSFSSHSSQSQSLAASQQDLRPKSKPLSRSGSFSGLVSSISGKSKTNRVSCEGAPPPEPIDVKVTGGMRTETYTSGLTIVKKVQKDDTNSSSSSTSAAAAARAAPAAAAGGGSHSEGDGRGGGSGGGSSSGGGSEAGAGGGMITERNIGLERKGVPWNADFHIVASMFTPDWSPEPPRSYQEALHRQQRLLHGTQRRIYLHLHLFIKEAVFALISAAEAHEETKMKGDHMPSHATSSEGAQALYNAPGASSSSATAAGSLATAASASVPTAAGSSATAASSSSATAASSSSAAAQGFTATGCCPAVHLPASSFAHATAACIQWMSGAKPDGDVFFKTLSQQRAHSRFVGDMESAAGLREVVVKLQQLANFQEYGKLAKAPLLAVIVLISNFFESFSPSSSSLSAECLSLIADQYAQLPFDTQKGETQSQQFEWATQFVRQLGPADQELLLLMTALMRHIIRASGGSGCEEPMVLIGKWVLQLLLGHEVSASEQAEVAVLSFLWFFARNDVAYACLILVKQRRGARVVGTSGVASATAQPAAKHRAKPEFLLHAPQHPLGAVLSPKSEAMAKPQHLAYTSTSDADDQIRPATGARTRIQAVRTETALKPATGPSSPSTAADAAPSSNAPSPIATSPPQRSPHAESPQQSATQSAARSARGLSTVLAAAADIDSATPPPTSAATSTPATAKAEAAKPPPKSPAPAPPSVSAAKVATTLPSAKSPAASASAKSATVTATASSVEGAPAKASATAAAAAAARGGGLTAAAPKAPSSSATSPSSSATARPQSAPPPPKNPPAAAASTSRSQSSTPIPVAYATSASLASPCQPHDFDLSATSSPAGSLLGGVPRSRPGQRPPVKTLLAQKKGTKLPPRPGASSTSTAVVGQSKVAGSMAELSNNPSVHDVWA